MKRLGAALLTLALLSIAHGASDRIYNHNDFTLIHDSANGELLLFSEDDSKTYSVELGAGLSVDLKNKIAKEESTNSKTTFTFGGDLRLDIEHPFPECTRLTWNTSVFNEIRDCVSYGSSNWFGGPEQWQLLWPMEKYQTENLAMMTTGNNLMGLVERYWINSESVYFFVDPDVPLFIDSNTAANPEQLCFIARDAPPFLDTENLILRYTLCSFPNIRTAQSHAVDNMLGRPTTIPDERMFRKPIWSTWARYKTEINQSLVLSLGQEIIDNGFETTLLKQTIIEIDDFWETCYGELQFNLNKFPDPKAMIDELHRQEYRVTVWVHPFINKGCPTYDEYLAKGYFVKNLNGDVQASWWNGGDAGAIDVTNPEAAASFFSRLVALKEATGLDGFKFDAGEAGYLPQVPDFDYPHQGYYSSDYIISIVNRLSELGTAIEARSGFNSQNKPLFFRILDKDSRWGFDNGLRSMVTTLMQMNVVGYPSVLPDMIGGNGYGNVPDGELFIRWLQANTFMPAIQFSYVPWQFDDQNIVNISQKFVDLHYQYSDLIQSAALQYVTGGGLSVNMPVCFILNEPDPVACALDDEFMMGDKYLIAPVMEPGQVSRDVYLPAGVWRDKNTDLLIQGPILLKDYPAPLDVLPYFYKEVDIISAGSSFGINFVLVVAFGMITLLY